MDLIFSIIKFKPFILRLILPNYFLKIVFFDSFGTQYAPYSIRSPHGHYLNDNFTWRLTNDIL